MRVSPEEQVSALLDGELAREESALVVRRVVRDEGLKATALRYALIGDALRGELPGRGPADLVSRVRAGLEEAPALRQPSRPWARYAAGFGVAASVALLAVVSLRGGAPGEAPVPVSATEVASPAAVAAYTVPPVYTRPASIGPDRLTRYYINHSEYATLMGGRSALSRIVARSPEGDASSEPARIEPVSDPR